MLERSAAPLCTFLTLGALAASAALAANGPQRTALFSVTWLGQVGAEDGAKVAVSWKGDAPVRIEVFEDTDDDGQLGRGERVVLERTVAKGMEVVPVSAVGGGSLSLRWRGDGVEGVERLQSGEMGSGCGWQEGFFLDDLNSSASAMAVWDDGDGPALYVGGNFSSASSVVANGIAKWDGSSWSALGTGVNGSVSAMAVWNDGGGDALYAGGSFSTAGGVTVNRVAKWDGNGWSALSGPSGTGVSHPVTALGVFDDGGGEALYVGGVFTTAGGVTVNNVARWDGSAWSALSGPSGTGMNGTVRVLAVWGVGGGEALYAGGSFTTAGGVTVNGLAKWDGSGWSALSGPSGTGMSGHVLALAVWDDGSGEAMYAGGSFATAGGVTVKSVAKWDGSGWSALAGPSGSGVDGVVSALTVWDDGGGDVLFVGGVFTSAGGVTANHAARFDGATWSALAGSAGEGLARGFPASGVIPGVYAFGVWDDGEGAALYAGGGFTRAGGLAANGIARWNGTEWSRVSMSLGDGLDDGAFSFAVWDDGDGEALYAGTFGTAGGVSATGIAKWNGTGWSVLPGAGLNGVASAMVVWDDGTGDALYVGGGFTTAGGVTVNRVAKWDGSTWSPLSGPSGTGVASGVGGAGVGALAVWDDGGGDALYVGGRFETAGGVPARSIAKWDGSTWSALGAGVLHPSGELVRALARWNNDGDDALYVGGSFTQAGVVTAVNIAKWDGAAWTALAGSPGYGTNGDVLDLQVWDDGNGEALYLGGWFNTAGGLTVNSVAKWDGSSWSALAGPSGVGVNNTVDALTIWDDGGGEALYAAGGFATAGGVSVNKIARWSGAEWSALSGPAGVGITGVGGQFLALAPFDDGGGDALFAGGYFTAVGGVAAFSFAKFACGDSTAPSDPTFASSTSHSISGFTSDPTIDMTWSGAEDELGGSGLDRYRVLFDDQPTTAPDDTTTVPHTTDPHSATSAALADGNWYFHLSTCDVAGNCAATVHRGPYGIDTTAPTGLLVSSSSHVVSTWSNDSTVDFTFSGATDPNGIAGYSIVFDQNAATGPDATVDQAGTSYTGTAGSDGDGWYVHVRACDSAGNCGTTVHLGPFWIDTTAAGEGTGRSQLVSRTHGSPITAGNNQSEPIAMSADGRYVAFWSRATDLIAGYSGSGPQAFLWDRDTGTVTLVSHASGSATAAGNGDSEPRAISADGRYVAFRSQATDLVAGYSGGGPRAFLWDRQTGLVTLVSRTPASPTTAANSYSEPSAISADGRYVAFRSQATDLIVGGSDAFDTMDAFSWDRDTGTVVLVSRTAASATTAAGADSTPVAISADGRYVSFYSRATSLVVGFSGGLGQHQAFLWDRDTQVVSLASHTPGSPANAGNGISEPTAMSADGRYVTLFSRATDLIAGGSDSNNNYDAFVWDRDTDLVTLVSHASHSATVAASHFSHPIAISGDGQFVAMSSDATNLITGGSDTNGVRDAFVWHRDTGIVSLVSRIPGSATTSGNGSAGPRAISADGQYVAFDSHATNLVAGGTDTNGTILDAFLWNRVTGEVTLLSNEPGSMTTGGNGQSYPAAISADGQHVAFRSLATNLIADGSDTNGVVDVLAWSGPRGGDPTIDTTSPAEGAWSNDSTVEVTFSGAADEPGGSGLAGYSVLFDQNSTTSPDATVDIPHTTDPHVATSDPPLTDGNSWYAHISTCDVAGNCTSTVHAGPFWIDTTAPGAPGDVSSTSHDGGPTNDTTIDASWGASTDASSGVASYRYAFTGSATPGSCASLGSTTASTTATSAALAAGSWYLQVCARDGAGNDSAVATGGPYAIDLSAPSVTGIDSVVSSGGAISEAEVVNVAITQLLVAFDEAMDETLAETLGNYLLVSAGTNEALDTTSCSVGGDDVAVAIDTADYTAQTATLGVNGGVALGDERHALVVCSSVEDTAGNAMAAHFVRTFRVDLTAPRVTAVDSTADTGDGSLDAGEATNVAITDLYLAFDEVLFDPPGDGTVGDVSNPASYRLVRAGGDGSLETTDCSAVAGTDTAVGVDSATWDGPSMTVSLQIDGGALAEGLYRLFACAALTDLGGSALDGDANGSGGDDFSRTFRIDQTAPSDPSTVESTTHTAGGWSSATTIVMGWMGASDGAAGLDRYRVRFDQLAATVPDGTVTVAHGADPHGTIGGPFAEGLWYFHLSTCDLAGNCTATVHRGPYGIDTTSPSAPGTISSSSHSSTPATDTTIVVSWLAANDALSGVASYRYGFTTSATPGTCASLGSTTASAEATSPALADGSWYAHACAVDQAGNLGPVATGGPYAIDTAAPSGLLLSSSSHTTSNWDGDDTIDVSLTGASDANGVAGYAVAFDQSAATDPGTTPTQVGTSYVGTATVDGSSWYAHARACDAAGNCGTVVHLGPFWIDTTQPGAPGGLASSSHQVGTPSGDPTIDVAWSAASDATSGVDGYAWSFEHSPTWSCDGIVDGSGLATTSSTLGNGSWYAHVCAVDQAGNLSAVATVGPFPLDLIGPFVVAVDTVADTGDGVLDDGEVTAASITQLLVAFDEPLAEAPAEQPASWSLVATGPDGVFDSMPCSGGTAGDVDYQPGTATLLADQQTVRLDVGTDFALPLGLYRLGVCPTVTDALGNASPLTELVIETTRTNLVVNPNFDSDLFAWTAGGSNPGALGWSTADAEGEATSGSLEITTSGVGGTNTRATACLDIPPGQPVVLAGVLDYSGDGGGGGSDAQVRVTLTGSQLGQCLALAFATSSLLASAPTDGWQPFAVSNPGSFASVQVEIDVTDGTSTAQTIRLDLLALDGPLFADGFETGDTSNWSSEVP